jgi:4-hydroxyphenylpyruvate dioxygenase
MTADFVTWDNPMGTAGFEFIEFAAPDPVALGSYFERLGFKAIARHRHKNVTLYRQGEVNFLINAEPDSFAAGFADEHGLSICAVGIRVQDAAAAYQRALDLGAWSFVSNTVGPMELNIPAIKGIGESLIYFVDRWNGKNGRKGGIGDISIYDVDFEPLDIATAEQDMIHPGAGLFRIDHLALSVPLGRMPEWITFYQRIFNFREIHDIDAHWHLAAQSKVMVSPCGQIRIPLYEEGSERSAQMQRYLAEYHDEGIQHIALEAKDIHTTVEALAGKVQFAPTADKYYDLIDTRLAGHGEDVQRLRRNHVLIDGTTGGDNGPELLLQIFTRPEVGPLFFEIVQRKGDHGFGEGNLQALIESVS